MFKCPLCDDILGGEKGLHLHIILKHKRTSKQSRLLTEYAKKHQNEIYINKISKENEKNGK